MTFYFLPLPEEKIQFDEHIFFKPVVQQLTRLTRQGLFSWDQLLSNRIAANGQMFYVFELLFNICQCLNSCDDFCHRCCHCCVRESAPKLAKVSGNRCLAT